MNNIVTVIQARRASSRFPDKILQDVLGKSMLFRMVERVQQSTLKGMIVIATTTNPEDDLIENLCSSSNWNIFRGHPTDLLDRHYQLALKYQADIILKIPSDCPLIDYRIIDKTLSHFLKHSFDYVSNLHPGTYPDGNDVEVMTFDSLEFAWKHATKDFEREHTTPYIWENPDLFKLGNIVWETGNDYSMSHRFTLDYPADYEFIRSVYEKLYINNPAFSLEDILNLIQANPALVEINKQYAGVNWYRHHINELRTIRSDQTILL